MHNVKLKVNCLQSMCLLGKLNVLNSRSMKVQFVLSHLFVFGRLKWKFLHPKKSENLHAVTLSMYFTFRCVIIQNLLFIVVVVYL